MDANTEMEDVEASATTQQRVVPSQSAIHGGDTEPQHPGRGDTRSSFVCGGVARIDVAKLERHVSNEVLTYAKGSFPRQSERYYKLMSVLHITRMLYHDGHCKPMHREFYKQLAQIHQDKQQLQQPIQQLSLAH